MVLSAGIGPILLHPDDDNEGNEVGKVGKEGKEENEAGIVGIVGAEGKEEVILELSNPPKENPSISV